MSLKISIITASYNSEKHLEQTVCSVLEQTYSNIEYIIVDGASSDGTTDIIREYQRHIDHVISESDKGIYDAFNKGVRMATGDVIYFLNSDDYLCNDTVIEKVASAFVSSETMVVYGDIVKWNEETGVFHHVSRPAELALLQQGKMPPHPGMFMRKCLIEQYGYFNLDYTIASDFDLVIKVFKDHLAQAVRIDERIAVFRTGGASTQLLKMRQVRDESVAIIESHFGTSDLKRYSQEEFNSFFNTKWLEIMLYKGHPASVTLIRKGIRDVAIFGSLETASYAHQDMQKSGIHVHVFMDNDLKRSGHQLNGVPISSPSWLSDNRSKIDAIIMAFGGNYEEEVKKQIKDLTVDHPVEIISWREMIAWNFE